MTSAVEKRRSSDAVSFSRKVVHAIGNVLRVTNRGILTLLGRKVNGVHRPVDPQSLSLLREHILGNRKDAIIDVFGLPPKVQASDGNVIQSEDPLNADTWYFPLDPVRGTILVVHFEDDLAIDAQFVDAPQIK